MHTRSFKILSAVFLLSSLASSASASDWYVARGGSGTGTAAAPFGRIQDAISAAQPGDTIIVGPGTFSERLQTVRAGTSSNRITIRSRDGRGSTIATAVGRVLTVSHPYVTVDAMVFDGQFGDGDVMKIESAGDAFILRNSEVRRTKRDAIDMAAPDDVLIEGSLVHHALNATNGRADAHGIVAGAARRLTIRNTEVHTFSGDAFQIDPGRSSRGWDDVLIEGCKFWLQPLPAPANGFAAGVVPGENAVDTKVNSSAPRPSLVIRDTVAFGFGNGLIGNMAAFNIKESVDAVIDRVTVYNSDIAFRLRAPANVRLQNTVIHSVDKAVRYEDNIQDLRIWNTTFGAGILELFDEASSEKSVLDVRNSAFLASRLPAEVQGGSNLLVNATAFVDAAKHNYHLTSTSPANDAGVALSGVGVDRDGTKRPQGTGYDVGAYERIVSGTTPDPVGDAEVVLHAWRAPTIVGNWQVTTDPSAAGGARLSSIDILGSYSASLTEAGDDYFEMTFSADAGQPYHLWIRGQAGHDQNNNDSVYVQFSGTVSGKGEPLYRIGTTSAALIELRECSKCGLDGWGWQDNGSGLNVVGRNLYFAKSGTQTIRILLKEDGMSIDQIVLSPGAYLSSAPGAPKSDATILPESR